MSDHNQPKSTASHVDAITCSIREENRPALAKQTSDFVHDLLLQNEKTPPSDRQLDTLMHAADYLAKSPDHLKAAVEAYKTVGVLAEAGSQAQIQASQGALLVGKGLPVLEDRLEVFKDVTEWAPMGSTERLKAFGAILEVAAALPVEQGIEALVFVRDKSQIVGLISHAHMLAQHWRGLLDQPERPAGGRSGHRQPPPPDNIL